MIKSSISEYRVGNKVILKAEGDSATRTVTEILDPSCELKVGDSVNDFSSNKDYLDDVYNGNFVITSTKSKKNNMTEFSCQIKSALDTWVDPRSKVKGWKVKVLDVYPDDYAGATTAKVELFDPEGNSQGEEIIYIHRQDVKIGETYDARIDGLMAMPRIIGVSNISYDEVPSMKNVTRERYLKSAYTREDYDRFDEYGKVIKSSKSVISVPNEIQNEYFEIEGRIDRAWNSGKLPFCDYDYLKAELDKAVTKYKFFSRYNNLYHVLEGRNDFWDRLNSFESIKSSLDYHDYDHEYQDKHEEDIDNWLYQINGKMCKPDPLIINDLNHWLDGNKEFFRGFEVNNPWQCVDISKCDDEIKEIFKNCTEGYCLSLLNCDLPYYENEVYLPNSNCYGTMKLIFPDEDNENQKVLWFIPNKLSEQTSSIVDNRHDNQKSITESFIQSAVNEINSEDPVEVLLKDAAVHFGATYKEDWYGKGIQEGDGNWSGGRWAVLVDESQDIPEIHFIAAKGSTGVVPMNGKTAEGEQFPEDLIYWIENKIRESDEDDGSFEDQVDKFRNIDLNGIDYMDSNSSSRTVYIKTSTKSDSVAEDMAEKIAEITGNENYMIYDFYETSEDSYDNLDFDTRDEKVIIFSL